MMANKENDHPVESSFFVPPTPILKKIGYGTGVSVYHMDRSPADHKIRSPWALKKVSKMNKGGEISRRVCDESRILKSLNHPNIVGYRGYTKTEDGREVLALENCGKSLGDLIEERLEYSMQRFSPAEILTVAKGMAQALDYLHTEAHYMHGDIKSFNVLIKDNHLQNLKLCDFGVSMQVNDEGLVCDKEKEAGYCGTAAWSAPEVLIGESISTKSDIFALGLTLWEMMTLKPPHCNMNSCSENEELSFEEAMAIDEESYGKRPPLPDDLGSKYDEVVKIFNWCTEQDQKKRPTAKEILNFIDRIV
uniref:Protein kinase domain-containing protein n=1 Tax=Clastoptera arizonana TaxID=38151 RepID=A0A1B6CDM0_9HEMI